MLTNLNPFLVLHNFLISFVFISVIISHVLIHLVMAVMKYSYYISIHLLLLPVCYIIITWSNYWPVLVWTLLLILLKFMSDEYLIVLIQSTRLKVKTTVLSILYCAHFYNTIFLQSSYEVYVVISNLVFN